MLTPPKPVSSSSSPFGPTWYMFTTVTSCGTNPANQAERYALDEPVLPAAGRPISLAVRPVPPSTTARMAWVAFAITSASITRSPSEEPL